MINIVLSESLSGIGGIEVSDWWLGLSCGCMAE